ncbi:MAG: 2-dehydro-3-deoxy-6-phosphogalactonate aldolase [Alphaproteobacteria bacterium]|nr:MAG: 2-dehydro-3-deoxy-6-phosphogalactonate aldolase [Alphaproteobacteria bacterium]
MNRLGTGFEKFPILAILRGLQPSNAEAVGRALVTGGITAIEVPLNRPNAVDAIEILVNCCGNEAIIGAGTVVTTENVKDIKSVGAKFAVSPNVDHDVIRATKENGMLSLPGVTTISEAYAAVSAGADIIKLFPCDGLPSNVVKAMSVVFPQNVPFVCVGGITLDNIDGYRQVGAQGFGIGSALFKPDMLADEVLARTLAFSKAYREL